MRRVGAALLALILAGCTTPDAPAEPIWVGPPDGAGGFASCASQQAVELAIPGLSATETNDALGMGEGIHAVNDTTLLWVWRDYNETQREDRITRLNAVQVHREPNGEIVTCTRVEIAAQVFVDGDARSYAVGALFTAPQGWPEGRMHVVVNWVVGCTGCTPPLRGNTTAHLD